VDPEPGPALRYKKRQRDRLIAFAAERDDWVVGYQDEVWWSGRADARRFAQPSMHAWAGGGDPLRLVQRHKRKDDPEPAALACYGVYVPEWSTKVGSSSADGGPADGSMMLRFVRGRPVSHVTTAFLGWAARRMAARGVRVWVMVWDNAPWHVSAEVKVWLQAHNRAVKRRGHGTRILVCGLPTKSPWLNPIEPKWLHGKRATCEPDGEIATMELRQRLCAHYGCENLSAIKQKTA
jgi:transposase